ncbi:MAG TPA: heavy metal-associated domain-containing protein [Yaniella sp.]|jgi:copper chaperone CopZ
MAQTTLQLEGLTCQNCVGSVTKALYGLPGVTDVDVELVNDGVSTAIVTSNPSPSPEQFQTTVADAGYTVVDYSFEL